MRGNMPALLTPDRRFNLFEQNATFVFYQRFLAMSESLTDRTEPQSRRGAGEARFGAKSLMQDKASRLSKWLCNPRRAYAAHIRRLDMAE